MNLNAAKMRQYFPYHKSTLLLFFLRRDGVVIGYDKNPSSHPFPDETEE